MIFPLILTILSLFTHLLFFGQPYAVVFDEVYNGSFISAYYSGEYYFDIHPPLAKILMKFAGDIINIPYNVDFGSIGNELPLSFVLLRILPLLAGVMLPIVIYFICRHINFSKTVSFAVGLLIILENSLLVHSRFILFDSMMIFFGFSAILLYLIYSKQENRRYLVWFSAILASLACGIKWTGFAFPLFIILYEIYRVKDFRKVIKMLAVYAVIGLIIYISIFAIHFSYLKYTGKGSDFMTDRFQKTLIYSAYYDNQNVEPRGFFGKFMELNYKMYEANNTLTATHDYASKWYTWPFMIRSVFYFQDIEEGRYIYLLGNPLIYLLGTFSIILLIRSLFRKGIDKKVITFISLGYLVNFIPFIFIGRVMFLYHYEAALVFSIIAIGYWLDSIDTEKKKAVAATIILASTLLFIYFSPLTYGRSLTKEELKSRMWLSTWR